MPEMIFRGVELEDLKAISKKLLDELEQIIGCSRDLLTIEHVEAKFIADGKIDKPYPFIEICWFDRGQDVRDKVANEIHKQLKSRGYEESDIYFVHVGPKSYYSNGEHY